MKNYFALALLGLGVTNFVFGAQAVTQWSYYSTLPLRIPLVWLIGGKLVWGIVFGITAWGVWRLRPWGRKLLLTSLTLYQAHIWLNHILFDVSEYSRQVWPFEAGISLITLAVVWGLVGLPSLRRSYANQE